MTAGPSIDPAQFLTEQLDQASPDLMRNLLTTFVNALLSAQADAVCGAGYGERSSERVNSRNGYCHRDLDTRVGTLDVAVPKLRQGSLYPDWLLERRKRAERALTSVVATCYLLGVSTRRMDKLVQALGITGLSKSQVSVMAKELDWGCPRLRGSTSSSSAPADCRTLVRSRSWPPTPWSSRSAKAAAWYPCTCSSRQVSTLMDTARSWGCRSPPARTALAGSRSSAT
jgi:hypothetical protein